MTNGPTKRERERERERGRPTNKKETGDRFTDKQRHRDTEKESRFNRGRETDPQRKTY